MSISSARAGSASTHDVFKGQDRELPQKQPFGTFTFDGHRDLVRRQVETIRVSRADTAMCRASTPTPLADPLSSEHLGAYPSAHASCGDSLKPLPPDRRRATYHAD